MPIICSLIASARTSKNQLSPFFFSNPFRLAKNDAVASKAWIDLEKGITTVKDNNDIFASLLDNYVC